ncbi:MAG: sigma-70 family RNA polymerase sigma factor [Bacteroidota bacterium]
MKERQLITACQKQHRKAQRVLFDRYYKSIFRLARRYLVDFHHTEDVVLIVFNKALKYINRLEYRGEGSLQKWLNTIAINESIRALKKVKTVYYQEEMEVQMTTSEATIDLDVEQVYHIIASMPEGYRTVFNLYAIDEYTHSEIAELLGISRNTSKSQLLKARRFIIQALNQQQHHEQQKIR